MGQRRAGFAQALRQLDDLPDLREQRADAATIALPGI